MRNIALYSVLAAASLLMIFSGCQTPHVEVAESTIMQKYLPYIQDGMTTREDVLLKLGMPSAQYEEEQIPTYVLCRLFYKNSDFFEGSHPCFSHGITERQL